jgi:hypothetical protein
MSNLCYAQWVSDLLDFPVACRPGSKEALNFSECLVLFWDKASVDMMFLQKFPSKWFTGIKFNPPVHSKALEACCKNRVTHLFNLVRLDIICFELSPLLDWKLYVHWTQFMVPARPFNRDIPHHCSCSNLEMIWNGRIKNLWHKSSLHEWYWNISL